jgi:ubiquitin carboxyl-terminal hydrolase 7
MQQDVTEFSRIFLSNILNLLKGEDKINMKQMFEGKMKDQIKCVNINHTIKDKEETYIDLNLEIQGCMNIEDSLKKFTEYEVLSEDDLYKTDNHGLQRIKKRYTFTSFPPVLVLNLKRFDFNIMTNQSKKIADYYSYDEYMDLTQFCEDKKEKYEYELFS